MLPNPRVMEDEILRLLRADAAVGTIKIKWVNTPFYADDPELPNDYGAAVCSGTIALSAATIGGVLSQYASRVPLTVSVRVKRESDEAARDALNDYYEGVGKVVLAQPNQSLAGEVLFVEDPIEVAFDAIPKVGIAWFEMTVIYAGRDVPSS